jgi:hypothetical protein
MKFTGAKTELQTQIRMDLRFGVEETLPASWIKTV